MKGDKVLGYKHLQGPVHANAEVNAGYGSKVNVAKQNKKSLFLEALAHATCRKSRVHGFCEALCQASHNNWPPYP